MSKFDRGSAYLLILPLLSAGFVAAWFAVDRRAPAERSTAEQPATFVASASPSARSTRELPPFRSASDLLERVELRESHEPASTPAPTRAFGILIARPAPDTKEPKDGRNGHLSIIDFGNSWFGIYAPYNVWVGKGYRSSYVTDSAEAWMQINPRVSFLKLTKRPFFFDSRVLVTGGSYPIRKAYATIDVLGEREFTGEGNGLHRHTTWRPIFQGKASMEVFGIPIELGASLSVFDLLDNTLAGTSTRASNSGWVKTGIWGNAYIAVGALGFYIGVEGTCDFLWGKPKWALASSFTKIEGKSASLDLDAVKLQLKVFVQATLWKKTHTIVSSGTLFSWDWPVEWTTCIWW